jgi:hypothetical protein
MSIACSHVQGIKGRKGETKGYQTFSVDLLQSWLWELFLAFIDLFFCFLHMSAHPRATKIPQDLFAFLHRCRLGPNRAVLVSECLVSLLSYVIHFRACDESLTNQSQISEWKRLTDIYSFDDTKMAITIQSCSVVSPERFVLQTTLPDEYQLTTAERSYLRMTGTQLASSNRVCSLLFSQSSVFILFIPF